MVKMGKTSVYCLEDHKSLSDEIVKRFDDSSRYNVKQASTGNELLKLIRGDTGKNSCQVVIISIHESKEHLDQIDHLTVSIKEISHEIGIILLIQEDKMDEVKMAVRSNIDSYIPKNGNSILRIHNTVKKLISHKNLEINNMRRRKSLYVLLVFILISLLLLIASYFRLPEFF